MRLTVPPRTLTTSSINAFVFSIIRVFELESARRRLANGSRLSCPSTKLHMLCPFCDAPFVDLHIASEQSVDTPGATTITLTCVRKHWVELRLEQQASGVHLSSKAQAPPPGRSRARVVFRSS